MNKLPEGFVPHIGTMRPVSISAKVDVILSNGSICRNATAGEWVLAWTEHAVDGERIVAYRLNFEGNKNG